MWSCWLHRGFKDGQEAQAEAAGIENWTLSIEMMIDLKMKKRLTSFLHSGPCPCQPRLGLHSDPALPVLQ